MNEILQGDAFTILKTLPAESVDCIITSPPYFGLRDYGSLAQIGGEPSLIEYIDHLLEVTAELKRVLKKTGTLWWNHGDSYAGTPSGVSGVGSKLNGGKRTQNHVAKFATTRGRRGGQEVISKSLTMQAHRLAIRMMDEQGWILRNQVIWHKPNIMPASVRDRFTTDFEPVFFFAKSQRYFFNQQFEPLAQTSIDRVKYGWRSVKANASVKGRTTGVALAEMGARFANPRGRNMRAVWRISTSSSRGIHIAPYPEKLVEPMILAGCPQGGVCLDPFAGSGTTCAVAKRLGRDYIGIELNPTYAKVAERRLADTAAPLF